jgi:hypothetical protein
MGTSIHLILLLRRELILNLQVALSNLQIGEKNDRFCFQILYLELFWCEFFQDIWESRKSAAIRKVNTKADWNSDLFRCSTRSIAR